MSTLDTVFNLTAAISLAAVAAVVPISIVSADILLPENARWQDRFTFGWLAFDAMIHLVFEGSFLYLSTFGRTVNASTGYFAELWKEYARSDVRFGIADPTFVSIEIVVVLGAGPLCCYILGQIMKNDPCRYYWIIVLCTAELYGGWVLFCTEWLTGSPSLDTSHHLYLWVYLFSLNLPWVVIPPWLMWDSYGHISGSLRRAQAHAQAKKD